MANIHGSYDIADDKDNYKNEIQKEKHVRTFYNSLKLQAFDKIYLNPDNAFKITRAVNNVMVAYTEFEMM